MLADWSLKSLQPCGSCSLSASLAHGMHSLDAAMRGRLLLTVFTQTFFLILPLM